MFASLQKCLVLVMAMGLVASGSESDDMDLLELREREHFLPPSDQGTSVAANADALAAALRPNGTWSDVNYTSSHNRVAWDAFLHLSRAVDMATAWAFRASPRFGNASIRAATDAALSAWFTMDLVNDNWWWNNIGAPQAIAKALLLTNASRDNATLVAQAQPCLRRAKDGGMTGANLVWLSQINMWNGLLQRNASLIAEATSYIYGEIVFSAQSGDNIQVDGSFHQHGPQLLAGSYGAAYVSSILSTVTDTQGTRWALPEDKVSTLGTLLLDGMSWMTTPKNSNFDFNVVGREVSRPHITGRVGFSPTLVRALGKGSDRSEEFNAYAARLEDSPNAPRLVGNRMFYCSDYMVHRGDGFMVGLHMRSNRTTGASCVNGEGKRDEHLSDGLTAIYAAQPGEHAQAGYWGSPNPVHSMFPALDWQHLPGVTAEINQDILEVCNGAEHSPPWTTRFVGGASDGVRGVAAMDLASHNLTAARAWFFRESAFIATGARLSCASSNPVATTIDTRRYFGTAPAVTAQGPVQNASTARDWVVGGAGDDQWWLWFDGVGYALTREDANVGGIVSGGNGLNVSLSIRNATGDWSLIGASTGTFQVPLIQITIEHGVFGPGASPAPSFAYRVFPGVSSADHMPALVRASVQETTILVNNADLQMVLDKDGADSSGAVTLQAVFWKPFNGSMLPDSVPAGLRLGCSAPAMVIMRVDGAGRVNITVASPVVTGNTVELTVDRGRLSGDACSEAPDGGTRISVKLPGGDYTGQSVTASCAAQMSPQLA